MRIELKNISKQFEQEQILHQVNCLFEAPSSTALLGINGSGKSTLLQIIAGFMNASKGSITYTHHEQIIANDDIFQHVSFCAPYLELIEEFTLNELLEYHFSFKKPMIPIQEMIQIIGLTLAQDKQVEKFSNGMKQRVKLAQSIFSETSILLLDEPCSNLDRDGLVLYNELIEKYCHEKLVIVASNDEQEFDFCKHRINVQDFKNELTKS